MDCRNLCATITLLGCPTISADAFAAAPDPGIGTLLGFAVVFGLVILTLSISAAVGAVAGRRGFWISVAVAPALLLAYVSFEQYQNSKSFENVLEDLVEACASEREWVYEQSIGVRAVRMQVRPTTHAHDTAFRRHLLHGALTTLKSNLETPDLPTSDWRLNVEDLSRSGSQAVSGDAAARYEFLLTDASPAESASKSRYLMRIKIDLVDVPRNKIIATKYEFFTNSSQSCYFSRDFNNPLADPLREVKDQKRHDRNFVFKALGPPSP